MLKLTVNLDTDQNLDIGEETVLNYNEGLLWKEFTQFHLEMLKKLKGPLELLELSEKSKSS